MPGSAVAAYRKVAWFAGVQGGGQAPRCVLLAWMVGSMDVDVEAWMLVVLLWSCFGPYVVGGPEGWEWGQRNGGVRREESFWCAFSP